MNCSTVGSPGALGLKHHRYAHLPGQNTCHNTLMEYFTIKFIIYSSSCCSKLSMTFWKNLLEKEFLHNLYSSIQ